MDIIVSSILDLLRDLIGFYKWIVILAVLASWGVALGLFRTYNAFTAQALDTLHKLTEPALAPIRRVLPSFAGVDLSPIVLFVALNYLHGLIGRVLFHLGAR